MSDTIYTPGMAIENKPQEEGALVCFARKRTDPDVAVLLSCAHVLFGSATQQTDVRIFQPPSSSSCCRNTHIATTMHTWDRGFRHVTVQISGEAEIKEGYETDSAIASLVNGLHFTNEIPQIGMIAGTPPPGDLGVVEAPPFGTPLADHHYVRFYSSQTLSVHYGTILRWTDTDTGTYVRGGAGPVPTLLYPWPVSDWGDELTDGRPNINQLLVIPRPPPREGYERYLTGRGRLYFGRGSDSGSVVVNHQNRVIGLLCRAGPKPQANETAEEWKAVSGIGILNPIHKVLEQMDIEIPANFSRTVTTSGNTFFVMPGVETDPDEIALERGRKRVEEQLMNTRLGRLLLGKFEQHSKETRRIVLGVRHALVAWHRHQGPAFVDHCLSNLRDPAHVVPTAINGIERAKLLEVMADVLIRYGSPKLRRDVQKYRTFVLQYGPGITTFDQVPKIICEIQKQWRSQLSMQGEEGREP